MARYFGYGKKTGGGDSGKDFTRAASGETGSREERRGGEPSHSHLPDLPLDAGDLHRRIEMYEFQLRNLRHELEQIKMQAILDGLKQSDMPATTRRAEPQELQEFDLGIFHDALYAEDSIHPGLAAMLDWSAPAPGLHTDPEPGTTALAPRKPAPEYTADPPPGITLSLLAKFADYSRRVEIQKALIFHLSWKLNLALGGDSDENNNENDSGYIPFIPKKMLSFTAALDTIMDLEAALSDARERLDKLQGVEAENARLTAKNELLREQMDGIRKDIDDHFNTRLREAFARSTERFSEDLSKKEQMLEDLSGLVLEYENELKSMRTKMKAMEQDLDRLREENERLRQPGRLENAPPTPPPAPVESDAPADHRYTGRPFGIELKDLLAAARERPSFESLLRLRRLFLKSRRYDDGIRILLELLDQREDRLLLPAVCVLVGELYVVSGRKTEAAYYMNNPLIEHDSLAQSLLNTIPYENIWDEMG